MHLSKKSLSGYIVDLRQCDRAGTRGQPLDIIEYIDKGTPCSGTAHGPTWP